VLAPEPSILQARAPLHRATRVTQKVMEAEPMQSKLKGRAKVKVNDMTMEEVQMEKLKKLKAERAIIQEMIDQLES
jgi:hypothetical protein